MSVYFQNGDKDLCCGCRGCEQICPTKAIKMEEDYEGFIYPVIDEDICIKCGLCEKVCPIKDGGYENSNALTEPEVYGAYNKDEAVLSESTSGGVFTAIIDSFFESDMVVFGAEFGDNLVVRHTFVENNESISKFRGSKYVQSDLGDSYIQTRNFLKEGKKVLFSGTPCQIAGLKSFLQFDYELLLCVDIVCHGVPSPKVFKMYKEYLENKYKDDLVKFEFRDKDKKGWDVPFVSHTYKNGKQRLQVHSDDDFIIGFYKGYYIRPVCHTCPFAKTPRVSDITIADFWGVEEINPKFKNKKGTSLILINTEKGKELYSDLQRYLVIEKTILKDILRFNPQLYCPTDANTIRDAFMKDLKDGKDFNELRKKYLKKRPFIKRLASQMLNKDTKNKIKKMIGK